MGDGGSKNLCKKTDSDLMRSNKAVKTCHLWSTQEKKKTKISKCVLALVSLPIRHPCLTLTPTKCPILQGPYAKYIDSRPIKPMSSWKYIPAKLSPNAFICK